MLTKNICDMKNENVLWWILSALFLFIGIGIPNWFVIPVWATLLCCIIGSIGLVECLYKLK